jgi:hypothetical protein
MQQNDHEKLIQLIEQMINDKVQLVHAGNLINWSDTRIPEIIERIKQNQDLFQNKEIKAGTKLQNLVSGQEAYVTNDFKNTIIGFCNRLF